MDDIRRRSGVGALRNMAVVIASILIAFSLDAWWSRRAESRAEQAHVRALRSDFEQNVARLQTVIGKQEETAAASHALLLAGIGGSPVPEDSLSRLLGETFSSRRFDPVMGAYEAVVGSGGLAQLRDDSLRLALADFASLLQSRYHERYADELYFDFLRSFTGRLGVAEEVVALDSETTLRAAAASVSRRALLEDPKFREHLALRYLAERDVAGFYRGVLEKAERVLALTQRALE